jgi:hypothetical protein
VTHPDVIRRVLQHHGVRDVLVARREGLPVSVVRATRLECRRNALDGTRYQTPKPSPRRERRSREPASVDFESMMTSN